jgi:putative transposase
MARPLRLEFPGAVYHVTSRGNARQDIVVDDRDRSLFFSLLAHVVVPSVCLIGGWGLICHAGQSFPDSAVPPHHVRLTPRPSLLA